MIEVINTDRINKGIQRLLSAPQDLMPFGVYSTKEHKKTTGLTAHRSLFSKYDKDISLVAQAALDWWTETIEARKALSDNPDEAIRQAWIDRPAGPASFPGFIAVVRDYWLECHALNKEVSKDEQVAPEVFMLSWLIDGGHADEVKVLSCMPYWPLGLDRDGNWV